MDPTTPNHNNDNKKPDTTNNDTSSPQEPVSAEDAALLGDQSSLADAAVSQETATGHDEPVSVEDAALLGDQSSLADAAVSQETTAGHDEPVSVEDAALLGDQSSPTVAPAQEKWQAEMQQAAQIGQKLQEELLELKREYQTMFSQSQELKASVERWRETGEKQWHELWNQEQTRLMQDLDTHWQQINTRFQELPIAWQQELQNRCEQLQLQIQQLPSLVGETAKKQWLEFWQQEEIRFHKDFQSRWEKLDLGEIQHKVDRLEARLKKEFEKLSQYLHALQSKETQQRQQLIEWQEDLVLKIKKMEKNGIERQKLALQTLSSGVSHKTFWMVVAIMAASYLAFVVLYVWKLL